jgi:hypothetical protein
MCNIRHRRRLVDPEHPIAVVVALFDAAFLEANLAIERETHSHHRSAFDLRANPLGIGGEAAIDRSVDARHGQMALMSKNNTIAKVSFGFRYSVEMVKIGSSELSGSVATCIDLRKSNCLAITVGMTVCSPEIITLNTTWLMAAFPIFLTRTVDLLRLLNSRSPILIETN